MFTLTGVPMIYAGQEVTETEKFSLFEKSQINWRKFDNGMNDLIGQMNVLRRVNSALTKGAYQLSESPKPGSIFFMFARNDKREAALVVVCMKNVTETITINQETLIPNVGNAEPELLMGSDTYLFEEQKIIIRCTGYDYCLFIIKTIKFTRGTHAT